MRTGPFQTHIQTSIPAVGRTLHTLYADFPLIMNAEFADFHVQLISSKYLRRVFRPQAFFSCDDRIPFKPLAVSHAFAMFEWGLNWCIETEANQYLMMHAAIIERDGLAAILPAPPGSGKSTLTAALVNSGWRLLSDELTLIEPRTGMAVPLARPINLKNQSIALIRDFVPTAVFGPVAQDTAKGSVAHLKPPTSSVERFTERAQPRWVIFPQFTAGANVSIKPYSKAAALLRLADHAFNYSQYGVAGFEVVAHLIDGCECYEFSYSQLQDAVDAFDSLAAHQAGARPAG